MSLSGKSVLITGATGGIGREICNELLKNGVTHLGAFDVASEEPPIVGSWKKNYPKASIRYFQVDVASQEELTKCYGDFTKTIENLDIVVNCAGIYNENAPKLTVDVNLTGVIQSTILAIEHMRKDSGGKGRGGVVLNIASIAGLEIFSTSPTYCATKFGVIAFTRALPFEREYLGIKFLSLCPGCTETTLFRNVFHSGFLPGKDGVDKVLDFYNVQSPEAVGKAAIKYILEGKTGSVWIIDDNKIEEVSVSQIRL